jgi:hypothetical protein
MATMAELLMQSQLQNNAMSRRTALAENLLASSSRAQSPLVAGLTSFLGTYEMGNIANQQKKIEDDLLKQASQQTTQPFEGTGMTAQAYNILLDPSKKGTPQYQAALAYASQPKTQVQADGSIVTIRPDLSWVDQGGMPTTGQPMVQPSVGNPNVIIEEGAGKQKFNESEAKAAGFADRMQEAETTLKNLDILGTDVEQAAKAAIPIIGNTLVTPEYQQFDQAKRTFINAVLRRESGAVISPEEFKNAEIQYFPQVGDDQKVIAQKRKEREAALTGMRRSAGAYYQQPEQPSEFIDMPKKPEAMQKPQVNRLEAFERLRATGKYTNKQIKEYLDSKGVQ